MRVFAFLLLLFMPAAFGQGIYSYVSEDGRRVLTNAPDHESLSEPAIEPSNERVDRMKRFRSIIHRVSRVYGLERRLIEAIIAVESNFDPDAVSPKNCKGLMQLHPDTAARFGVRDIFDPEENVEGGARYLQFLLDEFEDDLELVLAAYNAGENAVKKYNDIPPYAETRDYVRKVSKHYDLSAGARSAGPQPSRRVFRISLPEGGVLFTNTPVEAGR